MLRLITRASLTATPWKNGGGITREIACHPPGAGLSDFDWRLSTADVAQDGPFSRFEGIDRRLYILEGSGLDLGLGDNGQMRLRPGDHMDFCGEDAISGTLLDGPVTDLNIMVRRGRVGMEVEQRSIRRRSTIVPPSPTMALFLLEGEIAIDGLPAAGRFDTILAEGRTEALNLAGTARLLVIGFAPA